MPYSSSFMIMMELSFFAFVTVTLLVTSFSWTWFNILLSLFTLKLNIEFWLFWFHTMFLYSLPSDFLKKAWSLFWTKFREFSASKAKFFIQSFFLKCRLYFKPLLITVYSLLENTMSVLLITLGKYFMISLDAYVVICFYESFFNFLSRFLYLFCISSSNLSLVFFFQ